MKSDFFKFLLKTDSGFSKFFFKISLNFCTTSPQFSYRLFKIFLELTRSYPVISPKLLQENLNFLKISEKIFDNFYKIIPKCLKNFLKISGKLFPYFVGKYPQNTFFHFVFNFIKFLHNFSAVFLQIFHNFF